jgi:hypothetical protein
VQPIHVELPGVAAVPPAPAQIPPNAIPQPIGLPAARDPGGRVSDGLGTEDLANIVIVYPEA